MSHNHEVHASNEKKNEASCEPVLAGGVGGKTMSSPEGIGSNGSERPLRARRNASMSAKDTSQPSFVGMSNIGLNSTSGELDTAVPVTSAVLADVSPPLVGVLAVSDV